jgi:hypothetical protein
MLTILPTRPQDLALVVAPEKVVNRNLDKIRISASGIMGSSVLVGAMYGYASLTRKKDKGDHDDSD